MSTGEPVGPDPAGPEAPEPPAPPAPAPMPEPPGERHDTVLGIRTHNLIFVGLVIGVVLGLLTFGLDHHDAITLVDGTVLRGHVELHEAELTVALPTGEEVRRPLADALPDTLVRAGDKPSGRLHAELVWWFNLLGTTIFMSALKMLIAPLIFASIVAGIVSLSDLAQLKRIGTRTVAYYVTTTTIAVLIGLAAVLLLQPGKSEASKRIRERREAVLERRERAYEREHAPLPARDPDGRATVAYLSWLGQVEAREAGTGHEADRFAKLSRAHGVSVGDRVKEDLILPLLTNPFTSLHERNALGIIAFALLLGVAIVVVGEPARPVAAVFTGFNEVIVRITRWLMTLAPVCVAAIVAELIARNGPDVFATLAWYCAAVLAGIAVHVGVLLAIAATLGRTSPRALWAGFAEAWLLAFTTRSSAATMPVTVRCVTERLGVPPRVANFGIPVGATMNMDGTALYEGVAVIFLIQIFGGLADVPVEMTFATTFVIFVTAVLASVGAAAVPDAGLVTMVLVANAVGLPVYYIPLIFAVDAFLDMFRTSTNVLGDAVGCLVVARLEEGSAPAPT